MNSTSPTFAEHEFRKATLSEPNKDCVRVARRDGWVEVRDDKKTFGAPDDHRLVVTSDKFDTFLVGVRAGETEGLCLEIISRSDGGYVLRSTQSIGDGVELEFTEAEIAAFRDGIAMREFDLPAFAG